MSGPMRVALMRPTYESDFYAVSQMLANSGVVTPGRAGLSLRDEGDAVFTLTLPEGRRHTHLIREYAIHHLLQIWYGQRLPH